MTIPIVALDGKDGQGDLACRLIERGASWFKIGPAMMMNNWDWISFTEYAKAFPRNVRMFLDLKLADTPATVGLSVRRFVDAGIGAVSITDGEAGDAACEAALRAVEGSETRVWRVAWLTSEKRPRPFYRDPIAHGLICPVCAVGELSRYHLDSICPGIRLAGQDPGGHGDRAATPEEAARAGATYAVIGSPIYAAPDPVAAYMEIANALQ